MYSLSRLILILALAVHGYCGIVLVFLFSPLSWYAVAVLAFIAFKKRKKLFQLPGAHGTASWSGEPECEQAGMLKGKGLPLGRLLTVNKVGWLEALNALLDKKLKAKQACTKFMASLRRKQTAPLVRMPENVVHTTVFGPVGAGKSTGLVIPFLLEAQESCCVIDLSGELALATAEAKYRQGFEIHILDPYKVVTQ